MSRIFPVLAIAALTSATFAGCIFADEKPEKKQDPDPIVKKVEILVNDETTDSDRLEDVFHTWFEYHHKGDAAEAGDVTVTYTYEDGEERTEPLSRHAASSRIKAGDTVKISNVNLTSGLVVKKGDQVLAAREGLRADWLKVAGAPVPLSSSRDGVARYNLDGSSSVEFNARDFEMNEEEGGEVERVEADWEAGLDGDITLRSSAGDGAPTLTLDAETSFDTSAFVDAVLRDDDERVNMGAEGSLAAWLNFTVKLFFDHSRQLEKVGSAASLYADGDFTSWDPDHPRGEDWRPEDVEHPLVDERKAYEEETVEDLDPADEEAIEFLTKIWGMQLGVGDEYALHASPDDAEGDSEFRIDVVIQVLARESRKVDAGTRDTFKIGQEVQIYARTPESDELEFQVIRSTLWIDRDTYLPVFEQGSITRSFDRRDLYEIYKNFGEDAPFTFPRSVGLTIETDFSLELVEYSGDFRTAPVVGLLGFSSVLPLVAGASFARSDLGDEEEEARPAISFELDEDDDVLRVSSAGAGANWNRLEIQATRPLAFSLNSSAGANGTSADLPAYEWTEITSAWRSVYAGDYVALCGGGSFDGAAQSEVGILIRDSESWSILSTHEFVSIAACA